MSNYDDDDDNFDFGAADTATVLVTPAQAARIAQIEAQEAAEAAELAQWSETPDPWTAAAEANAAHVKAGGRSEDGLARAFASVVDAAAKGDPRARLNRDGTRPTNR